MDYAQALAATNADPDFQKLSYQDQTQVRDSMFRQAMQEDPAFQGFTGPDLQEVYKSTVFSAPALKDPQAAQSLQQLIDTKDTAKTAIDSFEGAHTMLSQALEGGLFAGLAYKANAGISKLIGTQAPIDMILNSGEDATKVLDYMNAQSALGTPNTAANPATGLSNFATGIADFIPAAGALGAVGDAVRSAPKVAEAIADSSSGAARLFWRTVVPGIPEALAAGATGVGVEGLNSALMQNPSRNPFQSPEQLLATFGTGAGFTIGLNLLTREVIPAVSVLARGTFGHMLKTPLMEASGANPENLQAALDAIANSSDVAPETKSMLGDYQNALVDYRARLAEAGNTIKDSNFGQNLSDEDRLYIGTAAATPDITIGRSDSGGYDIYHLEPNDTGKRMVSHLKVASAPTLGDAYSTVADILQNRLTALKGDPIVDGYIQRYAPWVYDWKQAETAGSISAEQAVRSGIPLGKAAAARVSIADRPFVGDNELSAIQDRGLVQAIPVRLDLTPELQAKLADRSKPFTFGDSQSVTPDAANSNAVILSGKSVDVPQAAYDPATAITYRLQGNDLIRLMDDNGNPVRYVPLVPNNIKLRAGEVNPSGHLVGVKLLDANTATAPVEASKITLEQSINREIPTGSAAELPGALVQFGANNFMGDLDPASVRAFARALTGNSELQLAVHTGTPQSLGGRMAKLSGSRETPELLISPRTGSQAEALQFTKELVGELTEFRGTQASNVLPAVITQAAQAAKQASLENPIYKLLQRYSPQGLAGQQWLSNLLQRQFGAGLIRHGLGDYETVFNGQSIRGTLGDIWQAVRPFTASPQALRKSFADAGIKLTIRKDGSITTTGPDGTVGNFPSIMEAAHASGIDTGVIPARFRPTFVELDPEGNATLATSGSVTFGKQDILKFLTSFETGEELSQVLRNKSGTAFINDSPLSITLQDAASRSKLYFANAEDAARFMHQELPTFQGLKALADSRGIDLDYENGAFMVRTGNKPGEIFRLNSRDEVEQLMRSYPTDNLDATELTETEDFLAQLPKNVLSSWKSFAKQFQPYKNDFVSSGDLVAPVMNGDFRQQVANLLTTSRYAVGRAVADGKIPESMNRAANNLIHAYDASSAEYLTSAKALHDIFVGKGKGEDFQRGPGIAKNLLPADRRELIWRYAGAQTAEERAGLAALTPAEHGIVNDLRAYLDTLGAKFGITANKYLFDYMPRIRKAIAEDPKLADSYRSASTGSEVLDLMQSSGKFNGNAISEIRPFFEYARKADLHEALFETDALRASLMYTRAGLRKFWMNTASQEYQGLLNKMSANGQLRPMEQQLLTRLHENLLGHNMDSPGITAVQNLGRTMMRTFGNIAASIKDSPAGKPLSWMLSKPSSYYRSSEFAETGRQLLHSMMSLSYTGLLGARPMRAFLNGVQVYSLYAPRFGLHSVQDAIKFAHTAPEGEIKGLLMRMQQSNTLAGGHDFGFQSDLISPIDRAGTKLMKWFTNGDELSRFIGYVASNMKFADSLNRLARGVFGDVRTNAAAAKAGFLQDTGLVGAAKTDPSLIDDIWNRVSAPGVLRPGNTAARFTHPALAGASHLAAREAIQSTMANYASWNKPMAFSKGLVGRVAGQLMMFPASYTSYLLQMMKNLPAAQKVGFLTTFIGMNAALYTAFSAAGMKVRDFIPLTPGFIGLSPYAESYFTVMQSMQGGRMGDDAKTQLLKMVSPVIEKTDKGPISSNKGLSFNYPGILPGSLQAAYFEKAYNYAQAGNMYKALLTLTAASTEADGVNQWSIDLGPGKVTLPIAPPEQLLQSALRSGSEIHARPTVAAPPR